MLQGLACTCFGTWHARLGLCGWDATAQGVRVEVLDSNSFSRIQTFSLIKPAACKSRIVECSLYGSAKFLPERPKIYCLGLETGLSNCLRGRHRPRCSDLPLGVHTDDIYVGPGGVVLNSAAAFV